MKDKKEIEQLAQEYFTTKDGNRRASIGDMNLKSAFIAGYEQAQADVSDGWISVEIPPKDGAIYDIVLWWKDKHKQEERKGYIFKEKHGVVDWINFFQQYGFYNNGLYEESFSLEEKIITHYRLHQPLPTPPQLKQK